MATCVACGETSPLISEALGACVDCLRSGHPEAMASVALHRHRGREEFDLPAQPPRDPEGIAYYCPHVGGGTWAVWRGDRWIVVRGMSQQRMTQLYQSIGAAGDHIIGNIKASLGADSP